MTTAFLPCRVAALPSARPLARRCLSLATVRPCSTPPVIEEDSDEDSDDSEVERARFVTAVTEIVQGLTGDSGASGRSEIAAGTIHGLQVRKEGEEGSSLPEATAVMSTKKEADRSIDRSIHERLPTSGGKRALLQPAWSKP